MCLAWQISTHFVQSDCYVTVIEQDKSGGLCIATQISIYFVKSDCHVAVIALD